MRRSATRASQRQPDAAPGGRATVAPVRHPADRLQRSLGNQAVQELHETGALMAGPRGNSPPQEARVHTDQSPTPTGPRVQAKLEIGAVGDPLEHEADRVAALVMAMPEPPAAIDPPAVAPTQARLSRQSATCQQDDVGRLRRQADGTTPADGFAPPAVHQALAVPGVPLDSRLRGFFEPRLGRDLADVRIHTGHRAVESARAVAALAYTVGSDVVFGAGQFAPHMESGLHLLAHELAHVAQRGRVSSAGLQRKPDPPKNTFNKGQLVVAAIAFSLMDKLGGESGQKKVKWVEKGDLLRVEGDATAGAGLAYRLIVMKNRDEAELDAEGAPELGVAPRAWLAPAPASAPTPVAEKDAAPVPAVENKDPLGTAAILDPLGMAAVLDAEAKKAEAKRTKLRAEIEAIDAGDIRANWPARKADFIAVACDPENTLGGRQMYQIWLRYWMDKQKAAYAEFHRVEDMLRAADLDDFVWKKMDFDKGKRKALGPEYEAAADRLDTANYLISDLRDVLEWLENWVDGALHFVTLQQINEKTIEILKAKEWFMLFMQPIILGAVASAGAPLATPPGLVIDAPPEIGELPKMGEPADVPPEIGEKADEPAKPEAAPKAVESKGAARAHHGGEAGAGFCGAAREGGQEGRRERRWCRRRARAAGRDQHQQSGRVAQEHPEPGPGGRRRHRQLVRSRYRGPYRGPQYGTRCGRLGAGRSGRVRGA